MLKASVRRLETGDWQVQAASEKHKAAHPQERSLTEPNRHSVLSLLRAGVKTDHIIALLRQNSDITGTAPIIYKLRDSERNTTLDGRYPLIALMDSFS